jgi:hypothetical protein
LADVNLDKNTMAFYPEQGCGRDFSKHETPEALGQKLAVEAAHAASLLARSQ